MKKFLSKIVASIMVIGAVSTFGLGSIAYAISATNVEPDTLAMGMDTNATVTFTPGIDIPADGKIKVTFGAGFDLTNVAVVDGTCSTMDGTFTTGFSGQTVTITRSGDGSINAFGSTEICTISNIKNPVATGTTGTYTIETTDAADSQIEIDSAVSADTIIDTANIPVVSSITAVQRTDGTGVVDIRFDFADGLGDDDGRVKVEYKAGADCSSGTSDPTLDEDTANISASIEALELLVSNAAEYQIGPSSNWITTSSGPNTVLVDWDSMTDVPAADGTYCLKLTPQNVPHTGSAVTSTLTLDNASPTDPAAFAQSSIDESSVSLGWTPSSDTNFDHYEIWYGQKDTPVESQNSVTTFTEHTVDDALGTSNSVQSADIDGDGDQDLAATSMNGYDVVWYENDGVGGLTKHEIDTNFRGADNLQIIDLDEDGDYDILAVAAWDDEIAWYENDGSESFTKNSIMTGIDYPRDVAAADLDGDGDIDVVGTSIYDAELIWHENDGSENFTPHEITDTYVDGIQAMDIGDMDGDGDYDIVVNNDSRSDVAWWENDGSGNFTKNSISTSGYNHTSFEVLDLDEDGDNDFIGPRLGAGIGWWVNDGSQNFSWSDIASFTSPRGMGYADFDLDGDLDVVGADQISSGPIKWAENDGSMSFTEHLVTNNNVRTHDKHSVEAVDLTGDGYADFVVGGDTLSTIDLAWYENSGTAFEWDDSDDVDLATDTTAATTVTGLIANSEYYFERWAVDIYGNTSTAVPAAISVYTAAAVPGAPTIGTITATTSKVTIDVNGNPVSTEFLIQEDNSGDYVQADGSLAAGEIWQSATTWGTVTVTGLEPSSANSFQVKARNGDLTETAFGTASDAVALSNVPSAPTVSSASTSSINVIINENSNTSDAEYSIDVGGSYVQAGGNLDVGEVFQDYATWGGATGINVTGLSPATNHSVTVKARNTDLVETVASGAAADYTLPATPGAPTIGTITETTADVTVSTNGNPASATYIIQESTSGTYVQADGTLSVGEIWQNAAAWGTVTVTGLTPSSVNTFITKAKSLALDESAFGAGSSAVALSNIPSAPTVSAVSTSSINVIINQNSNSASASYSIPVGSNYVQADGSLGVGEVFQDYATWGGASGITVTGLAESTSYSFTVKARNADLVTTVASAVGSATTQTTPAPAQSTGSAGGGGGDNEEESESETEAAEESQEAEASEEVDSEEEVAEERITERDVPVEEREEMVEERAEELSESIDEEEPDVEVSAQEEEPLVEVNIDELFADIDQLEEFEEDESEEEEETAPVIEKSEEEQLVDRILTNDDADLTEEEKDSDQEAVNNLIEQYFEEYLDTDEETGETKRPTFYSSYDEAEEAREENPDDEIFDTSSDENEDGVSDIYQIKKNFPEDDGDEYSLVDDIVLGGDPYKADINLVTDIPRITNYGKGQKVRGGDVVFVVGTSKQQNLSIYILNEEKEVIKTINSRIDEGIKDVVFTELPAGKYYAVPAGDAGQGKPVKLIVEEESDDMKLVLIDDAYIMKMIFNMVQDYELVPEDFVPEKTYIEGHAEPGTTVIVSWKSVVLNSVVVADASQGYFKVEVPKKLALGNHDALVYAYDEDSLIYSITRRAAFRKVNE